MLSVERGSEAGKGEGGSAGSVSLASSVADWSLDTLAKMVEIFLLKAGSNL